MFFSIFPTSLEFVRDFGGKNNITLARIFSVNLFNPWEISEVLSHLWGLNTPFQIREVDQDLFIIIFFSYDDFFRVTSNGLWNPYGNVFAAMKAYPGMQISIEVVK